MEKSSFFDSDNGDRKYGSVNWAEYFSSFIENGVFLKTGNELGVNASLDGNRGVILRQGKAFINGYFYYNDSDKSIEIPESHATLNRIDSIVIQWNLSERQIRAKLRSSTPAESPTPVTPVRNAEVWELVVAEIFVGKGSAPITIANIKDKRFDISVCGIVTSVGQPIDTSKLDELIDKLFTRYDSLEGRIEAATLIRTFSAVDSQNKIEITAEGETVNTGDIIAVKLTNPGNDLGVQPGATLKFNDGQAQKISVLNGEWKNNPIAQYATVLVEKTSTGWNLLTFDSGSSGNIPDFSPSLTRVGHTLYKNGADSAYWGMERTFFCMKNSNGSENSTEIGAAVLAISKITPTVNLRISGELNANHGPIIIPDLFSSPFDELTISLDFSDCEIVAPNTINLQFNLIDLSYASKVAKVYIRGLTVDHEVAPIGIININCSESQSKSVYIVDCNFLLGRHSTEDRIGALISEGTSGIYPTFNFVNCTFKSNYKEDYGGDFDKTNIVIIYPDEINKSFIFFQNCKFGFLKDGEYAGAMASSYGTYGITNIWSDNHFFKFSGCVMAHDILSAQSDFSNVTTTTNLQKIFNNTDITGSNILFE